MNKLWSNRFSKSNSQLMEEFNASIFFDRVLFEEDITGSKAHASMLAKIGILSESELSKMLSGLETVRTKLADNQLTFLASEEDIHTKVEQELRREIGDLAGKLHTARSRNDQVNNDLRLFVRKNLNHHRALLLELLNTLLGLAKQHQTTILPGYTHLQPAQPITLAFYLLSYFFMFERDLSRLSDNLKRINLSPLGSGALAGVNYPVDRRMVQQTLGYDDILPNALDAVSDRDFIIEYGSSLSMMMMHLSRMSEEFIIYANPAFRFIDIDEAYSTGSSIMPNKKNPDSLELIRGKTGRVYGNLFSLLTVMKGLPLAYNKDLQEDKEGIIDSIDAVTVSLRVLTEILKTSKFFSENMRDQCEKGYLQATDIADYLVKKGMPFRTAHEVSAGIVKKLSVDNQTYQSLSLADFKAASELFEEDIFQTIQLESVIKNKQSEGSTSFDSVAEQLKIAEVRINDWKQKLD